MILSNLPVLQVIIPLLAAPICALFPANRIAPIFTAIITFITLVIALTLASNTLETGSISYPMGGWKPPFGIEYNVDLLSSFILVLVSAVGFFSSIYAFKSVDAEIPRSKQPLFYSMFLLCFAGLLGITITNDAFNIYVFLEISSLATYALIAMGKDRRALLASLEYLILGTIGATFILIAVGFLYMMTGSLNISDIALRMPSLSDSIPVKAALAFFTIGLALKIAIFPLHLWLTNSYTNAPSFVSTFLSATATKVGIYVLIRVLFSLFGYEFSFKNLGLDKIVIVLGVFAIIIGAIAAVFQNNLKRLLAYSSVSQVGYIILGIGIASQTGLTASLIHVYGHALAKAALFMAAGCIMLQMGGVRLNKLQGVARKMPITMALFVISGLSLIGVPGTAGFISKWYLLQAAFEQQMWFIFAVIIFGSLLAVIYIWKIVEIAYFSKNLTDTRNVTEAPLLMLLPMAFLVLLTIIFGFYTQPIVGFASNTAEYLFNLSN